VLIAKGTPAPSEPWRILEVAIGQAPDILALRLAKEFKRIHEQAIEALVPFRRNSQGEPEWIVEHVYVRGANGSLRALARTPGIESIREETAPADWITELLSHEKPKSQVLKCGQFVRVLTGVCARMCGHIERMDADTVTIGIALRTKKIKLHTYPKNLQLVKCLPAERVFFFHPELFP